MNEPSRALSDATRRGPARSARAYPISAASTCQPPPSVPAKPSVSAPRRPDCAASGVDKANAVANIETMDRRTFVLLTGAASATLIRPARAVGLSTGRAVGRLRFELDDRRLWSLWYYGDGRPVALIQGAVVGAWVGDQLVTLAELEDSTVGTRRPPGGEAVAVRGRAAGVYIETEFLTGGDTDAPQAAVAVTIYPDRDPPTLKGVPFFQA